jgi:hypothetical protein
MLNNHKQPSNSTSTRHDLRPTLEPHLLLAIIARRRLKPGVGEQLLELLKPIRADTRPKADEVAQVVVEVIIAFLEGVVRHGLEVLCGDGGDAGVGKRKLLLHGFAGSVNDEEREYKDDGRAPHIGCVLVLLDVWHVVSDGEYTGIAPQVKTYSLGAVLGWKQEEHEGHGHSWY